MPESMSVRCPECGYDNRDNYRFCGMCGASLRAAPAPQRKVSVRESAVVTEPPPPSRPVSPREPSPVPVAGAPVSGPSFLGLADAPVRNDVGYLLEDEESHSGGKRMLIAFLLLVVAGGLVYWHWRRDGFPWSAGSSHPAQAPVFSGASTAPSPGEPLPPPASDTPRSATPPVVPSSDEAHMTKSDDVAAASKENSNAVPANTAAEKSSESLATAVPDSPPPAGPSTASSESTSGAAAGEAQTSPEVAKPAPAANRPRNAVAKPAPESAPVSNDDQLVAEGEKYLYGNGVPANCDRAQKNLRTAAGHGSSRALSMLGTMYATGHCADRDLPNAYRSFAKALHLDPNNSRIQSDLEILWRQMSPEERQAATHNN